MKPVDEFLGESDRFVGEESLSAKYYIPYDDFMGLSADEQLSRFTDLPEIVIASDWSAEQAVTATAMVAAMLENRKRAFYGNSHDEPHGQDKKPPAFSRIINPADWEGLPVPPRKWIVPDYIPDLTVTMLAGDGGTGKSLLTEQLAVARAVSGEWIGLLPEAGRTLILSAEDDSDEMQRRLDDIRKFYGVRMADLSAMRLVDLVGEDSILGALMKGQIQPTDMYHALDVYMGEFKPGLTALDVLADMYAGDENSRPQVRQFVGLLKKLARKHSCAILLLSHPSLTGLNSGSGTSGSTGWNNAVRSRLYFQTVKSDDGTEPDVNLRTLQGMKSNYGVRGGKIDVDWKNGLFVPVKGPGGFDKLAADRKAADVFVELLKAINRQGRRVSANPGVSYAPTVFAEELGNHGIKKQAFADAMKRLLAEGTIKNASFGPPSHLRSKLEFAGCSG
jgi:RecA-family ATPase